MVTNSNEVNASQKKAVEHDGGHLLIVAGPGTGKTHTLIRRIARRAEQLSKEERVLAITFTNKAALEMKERLSALMPALDKVVAATFHGFALRFLRQHQRSPGFTVASPAEIESLLKNNFKDLSQKEIKGFLDEVSGWKSARFDTEVPEKVKGYDQLLRTKNLLDYDDLLLETLKTLKNDRAVLNETRAAYPHIFVDEYQDINRVQHELLKILVGPQNHLTAIGDPNQSIYGFRGSEVRYFESFAGDFKPAHILTLTANYRSAANLLEASIQMIAKNKTFDVPPLVAAMFAEGRLVIYESPTEKAEAEYVVHQIEKMVGGTSMFSHDTRRVGKGEDGQCSFGDIAVLYRLNSQKNILEEAFGRSGIPCQIAGDKNLLEQPFVRDILSAMKRSAPENSPVQVLKDIAKTAPDNKPWKESFQSLERLAKRFERSEELFDYLILERAEDRHEERCERVSLMTLHASKGLEFPVVFIVGCEDNLIPFRRKDRELDEPEERRLFYVGMTRAKTSLYLTHCRRRRLWGEAMENGPSPYLKDIEEKLKSYERAALKKKRPDQEVQQLSLFKL